MASCSLGASERVVVIFPLAGNQAAAAPGHEVHSLGDRAGHHPGSDLEKTLALIR